MKTKAASFLFGTLKQLSMAACVMLTFTIGYGAFSDNTRMQCSAAGFVSSTVTISPSFCAENCYPSAPVPLLCEISGTASTVKAILQTPFETQIKTQARQFESWVKKSIDGFVESVLSSINIFETNLISWWDTMWSYNLRPGLQAMTTQVATATVEQTEALGQAADVNAAAAAKKVADEQEIKDKRTTATDDTGCAVATMSGGLGRATGFNRAMRQAYQNRGSSAGSNKKGTRAAGGRALQIKAKNETYESTFCDPEDNGGKNLCGPGAKPEFYNADTKVTEILYNKLTIPVTDPNYQAAVEEIVENISGDPSADPIDSDVLKTAQGQELWLNRRSFLARYAVVGSIPRMIAGAKMPGAGPKMAEWVNELRKGTGSAPLIAEGELSDNPSYREVMHAVTIDRFNSNYASSLIADKTALEMEKLTLSVFHLMMLRDYYELLERTALTLAVQVTIMSDQERPSFASKAQGDKD